MTVDDLKKKLHEQGFPTYSYDIIGLGDIKGYDGMVMTKDSDKYNVFYEEKGIKQLLASFSEEDSACKYFLAEMNS